MDRNEIPTEQLPGYAKNSFIAELINEIKSNENLSPQDLFSKIEFILSERAECLCEDKANAGACKCGSLDNKFILGQFYFDNQIFRKAFNIFDTIKNFDYQALYQVSVILYDDLLDIEEKEGEIFTQRSKTETANAADASLAPINSKGGREIDTKESFNHPNKDQWKTAVSYMLRIAQSNAPKPLLFYAQYNLGKAYYQGFGVKQSDQETEKWWLAAGDDGNPEACVTAMTMLAFFYSRKESVEFYDLKKAFFWHNEACGNGSLESQGALGAIYYYGIGRKRDLSAAYECLTQSGERGNVYALGLLCDYYYTNKFFIKAADLSEKVSALYDVDSISHETSCTKGYIAKGISLASFIYARCLHLAKGTKKDADKAQYYYKRSFLFDPDQCQLMQNYVTHQKI